MQDHEHLAACCGPQGRDAGAGANGATVRDRDAMDMTMNANVLVVTVAALVADYLMGRERPWLRLGDWTEDQVRFAGTLVKGGAARLTKPTFFILALPVWARCWRGSNAASERTARSGPSGRRLWAESAAWRIQQRGSR